MGNRYDIILKQGTLEVELSSDDDYFMTKQLNKWYQALLDPSISFKPPVPEPPSLEEKLVTSVASISQEAPSKEAPPNSLSVTPVQSLEALEILEPPQPAAEVKQPSLAEDFTEDDLDALLEEGLSDLGSHQAELSEPSIPLTVRKNRLIEADIASEKPPEDDFEAVMASIQEDMAAVPKPLQLERDDLKLTPIFTNAEAPEPELPKFTVPKPNPDVLGIRKIDLELVESLTDLYERSTAQTPEDFLMLSAYYLSFCERQPKYSLKKLNASIVKSGLTPVNHSVIEAALEKQLIELVPDMTGTAEVIEYRITAVGPTSGKAFTEALL